MLIMLGAIGAGISVQAGIPDFRSSEGLFQSLKKDHPTLSSGKDLFDASVFNVSSQLASPRGHAGRRGRNDAQAVLPRDGRAHIPIVLPPISARTWHSTHYGRAAALAKKERPVNMGSSVSVLRVMYAAPQEFGFLGVNLRCTLEYGRAYFLTEVQ